jgi:hypothetical protein
MNMLVNRNDELTEPTATTSNPTSLISVLEHENRAARHFPQAAQLRLAAIMKGFVSGNSPA